MIGGLPPVIEKSGTRALEQQASKESTAPVTDPAKAPEERETNLPEGAQSSAALQSNNNGGCLKFVVSCSIVTAFLTYTYGTSAHSLSSAHLFVTFFN